MRITVFSFSLLFFSISIVVSNSEPDSSQLSARTLDALIQARAFEALSHRYVRTGHLVNASLPSSLAGISIAAVRLRTGSLRSRGFKSFGEFRIPPGVTQRPYVKRVALVYQNLGTTAMNNNLSSRFYPLPGFEYVSPLIGLVAYDASDITAEIDLIYSGEPIAAKFNGLAKTHRSAVCVFFDLHGSVQFDRMKEGNWCEMVRQGHVAVAIESQTIEPSPAPSSSSPRGESYGKVVALCLVGGLVAMAAIVVVWVRVRAKYVKKLAMVVKDKESGELLEATSFGVIRAKVTRTRPVLEDRYVP